MLLFFFLSCLIENFCLHLQRNFICNCNCLIINMFESEFESRFPLKMKSNSFGLLFSFCMVTKIRPKRPQTPLPGAGGVNTTREKLPTSIVGSSLVFRNPVQARPTISVWRAILSYRKSLLHNNYQPIEIIANFVISF